MKCAECRRLKRELADSECQVAESGYVLALLGEQVGTMAGRLRDQEEELRRLKEFRRMFRTLLQEREDPRHFHAACKMLVHAMFRC